MVKDSIETLSISIVSSNFIGALNCAKIDITFSFISEWGGEIISPHIFIVFLFVFIFILVPKDFFTKGFDSVLFFVSKPAAVLKP